MIFKGNSPRRTIHCKFQTDQSVLRRELDCNVKINNSAARNKFSRRFLLALDTCNTKAVRKAYLSHSL